MKLTFITQPAATVAAGAAMSVQVAVQDAAGRTTTNLATITIVANSPTSVLSTLGGTVTQNTINGVASFNDLTIDKAGAGYTLTAVASDPSLSSATTNAITVTPGVPAKLVVSGQPSTVVSQASISPAVQVTVQDAAGNIATNAETSVTLALTSSSGATTAVLSGSVTQAAANGVATFSNIAVDRAGTGYLLTATAPGLTSATSNPFSVNAGPPAKLAFAVDPSSATSGATISPAVQVGVQDASGNSVATASGDVTLAITSGTGVTGAVLSGTLTRSLSSGSAVFDDLKIDNIGTGYTLTATTASYTSAASAGFDVTVGAATQLAVIAQPSNAVSGAAVAPAVEVEVRDAGGNRVTTSTASVTLAIGTNPGSSTLGGTATVAAIAGVATFNDLTLNKSGTGYTLVASSTGFASATSAAFNVVAGAAAALGFSVQPPSSRNVNATFSSAVEVRVTDAAGNAVTTANDAISIALLSNAAGAGLGGTTTESAVNGVAAFPTLTLDKPGQGFTLQATAAGLTSATSTSFNIIGPATTLVFTTQPASGVRNATIAPSVELALRDAAGNLVTSASNTVTIAIGTNPGSATLAGTVSRSASGGVATFDNLSISAAGNSYTLLASASGVTSATSAAFDVAEFGAAAKLGFIVQPSNADVATVISPAVQVAILDASGNTVTTSSASVTVAFGANPGSATLGGTLTATASSGLATFSNLTVSAAGANYALTSTSPSLTSATSATFSIVNPGAAVKLGFIQQPTGTTAGSIILPAVTVAIQNSAGATVTSDNSTVVSITVASGPVGGTVGGTLSATAVNGVAAFSTLKDTIGGTYALKASAEGLTSATSSSYVISAGVSNKLLFLTQPTNTVAGEFFSQNIHVAVADVYGNTVPTATNSVTINAYFAASSGDCGDGDAAWQLKITQPGYYGCAYSTGLSAPVAGTTTVAAANGVASFVGLRPRFTEIVGVVAAAPGVTSAYAEFTVSPSTAREVWVDVPSPYGPQLIANKAFAVTAYVLDSLHNQVNVGSNVISLAIGSNPSAATLDVANNLSATAGKVTFNVSLDKAGNGFTLSASTAGLSILPSFAFNVAAFDTPSRLAFNVQPANASVGAAISPAVKVCVQDGVGNTVTTATNTITLAIGTNPGSATLGGPVSTAAVSGCATFANLTLSAAGTGYTLSASATSLTTGTSTTFNITP